MLEYARTGCVQHSQLSVIRIPKAVTSTATRRPTSLQGLRVLPRILEQLPRHDHHLTADPSCGLWIPFVAGCMMGVALHPWPILLTALIDINNIYMAGGTEAANV